MAVLFILSGVVVALSLLGPLPTDTHRGVLLVFNGAEVACGVLAWYAPWTRRPWLCFCLFVPAALAFISVANVAGGFDPYSFAVYFTVVFVWIGVSSPRWTSLMILPFAVLAYLAPLVVLERPTAELFTVAWVLPVWLLVAESLAWVVGRLRRTELTLAQANDNVGALLTAATTLGGGACNEAEAADVLARVSRELLGCSTVSVLFSDPETADLLHHRGGDRDGLPLGAPEVTLSSPLRAQLPNPRVRAIADHHEPSLQALLTTSGAQAAVIIVLDDPARPQHIGGLVVAGWSASGSARPDPDLLERAAALLRTQGGRLLAQARSRERMAQDAETDPLTGLANRRRLRTAMDTLQPGCAVAVIDLDHFKVVNDRFGHPAGDQVLRDLAACLGQVCRTGDTAARLGGEEFVLVFPDGGTKVATGAIQRLRALWQDQSALTTFSAGIAEMTQVTRPAQLLHRADEALYRAKTEGRNRTAVAERVPAPPMPSMSGSTPG